MDKKFYRSFQRIENMDRKIRLGSALKLKKINTTKKDIEKVINRISEKHLD